jgi:hypothetical protein
LLLGSVCGIVEITRNAFHLWAKCLKKKKLYIILSLAGFLTAFLFLLNFVLMMLWRFSWEGRVCSGFFLTPEQKLIELSKPSRNYQIVKGEFILQIIHAVWAMAGIVTFSVLCIAITMTYRTG